MKCPFLNPAVKGIDSMDNQTNSTRIPKLSPTLLKWIVGILGVVVAVLAFVFQTYWLPPALGLLTVITTPVNDDASEDDGHSSQNDSHAGHDDSTSLELSPQARKNVGLRTGVVELQTFIRTVSMPAIVVGKPGRSEFEVTATLGGRVTKIYPIVGEAILPGQPLFDLRLTHEELVKAQSELLRSAEQLDVELAEIRRLEQIVRSGAIPGKRLIERQYERQTIEAAINTQRQSLQLHGLTASQVSEIVENRRLVSSLTVVAPSLPDSKTTVGVMRPFTLRKLQVKLGQYVDAGAPLCLLMDYSSLYIEGRGFEQDSDTLLSAEREAWDITAQLEQQGGETEVIRNLKIEYIDSEVESMSRALHFYVALPNEVAREKDSDGGHRYVTWKYRPGQRMQLKVPVERWPNRIVLPIDAVAKEGVEYYVFQQNGNHFDRTTVQVEYHDQFQAVIANDGTLFPGDTVAVNGANQLQMALKNKSGGGVDPHAGHNH